LKGLTGLFIEVAVEFGIEDPPITSHLEGPQPPAANLARDRDATYSKGLRNIAHAVDDVLVTQLFTILVGLYLPPEQLESQIVTEEGNSARVRFPLS
jgi:hypothetical protein